MSSKDYQINDEIDLIEIFLIIWNGKLKIFFFILVSAIAMGVYLISQPAINIVYKATTEIRPISTFDEFEYEGYNNYLKNMYLEDFYFQEGPYEKDQLLNTRAYAYASIDNSSFFKIDKEFLLDLFIDKINENNIFINAIKKFKLVNEEDYKNYEDYENAVIKLASSIQIIKNIDEVNNENKLTINFITKDKDVWENILKYLEINTNIEIGKYLSDTFDRLISNQVRLKQYKIEDLKILETRLDENDNDKKEIKLLRRNLSINKNIQRLQNEFNSTPIIQSESFHAAKIMVESTKYKNNIIGKNHRTIPMIILSIIIGLFVGILFVLISNSLHRRNKKDILK